MKAEHKGTGDEFDMRAGFWDRDQGRWKYWYAYISRPGVRKQIKRRSHRIDRAQARRRIRNEEE